MTEGAITADRSAAAGGPGAGAGRARDTEVPPEALPAGAVPVLSERERDVLRLLGCGLTNKEAAQRLGVAPETVKSHIKHIFRKLAVERRAHAVSRGHSLGLIGPAPR